MIVKRKQKRRRQTRQISLSKEERKELLKRIRQAKDRKTVDRLRIILFKLNSCRFQSADFSHRV